MTTKLFEGGPITATCHSKLKTENLKLKTVPSTPPSLPPLLKLRRTSPLQTGRNEDIALSSGERGAVLLGALLIVSMLLVLSALSLNLATQETISVAASNEEAASRSLARSGAALIMQWFHDPRSVPDMVPRDLFVKRHDDLARGPSFFDARGRSQLAGTADEPDLLLEAANPDHDRLLNPPLVGRMPGLGSLGRILALRLYGPARPGMLGMVGVTVGTPSGGRTFTVELGVRRIPPLRAALQAGSAGNGLPGAPARHPLPLWVHWGDVRLHGDVFLGRMTDVPAKTPLAPVSGQSYAQMSAPEDRWLDVYVGGEAIFTPVSTPDVSYPANVHPRREPVPGLRADRWDGQELKDAARRFGAYYLVREDGYLYPGGTTRYELRRTADEVFASAAVGDHHGLVYIDAPPPREADSGTRPGLTVTAPYVEGLFVVDADLHWRPRGPGRSVPAVSPPPEGRSSLEDRVPVTLSRINLRGVLVTSGSLTVSGRARVHGALAVGGAILADTAGRDRVEVWYDHELGQGLVRGLPLVYFVPGSFREVM